MLRQAQASREEIKVIRAFLLENNWESNTKGSIYIKDGSKVKIVNDRYGFKLSLVEGTQTIERIYSPSMVMRNKLFQMFVIEGQ